MSNHNYTPTVSCIEDISCLQYYSVLASDFSDKIDLELKEVRSGCNVSMVNYVCIIRCDRATILGTEYKCDKCWLMIAEELLPTGYVPKFGKLFDIILHGPEHNIIFVFVLSSTVCYNPRVGAYMVAEFTLERACFHEKRC